MSRVIISEEETSPLLGDFQRRHPFLTYVFGDMVRGLYWVGCLALDVFVPLQVRLSFPGLDALVLPLAALGLIVAIYIEIRIYRRFWPRSGRRRVIEVVEKRAP
ncbi:MAG TPA: hypothetical protein VEO20_10785 [Thermoplasmata archaeon]|nr:hypothetical protein [Thermoplasmata archaeon]